MNGITTSSELDLAHLQQWIGNTETAEDWVSPTAVEGFQHTLDYDETELLHAPPGFHWTLGIAKPKISEVGRDGHAALGGFLPPMSGLNRMWAGSVLAFKQPLAVGQAVERNSTVSNVELKSGRSGPLVFVTVQHRYDQAGATCFEEEQKLVFRTPPDPGKPVREPDPAPTNPEVQREIIPNPVMLFRYSALTFNGHRIHYDVDYCRDVEGYPGLVVHGPLQATLLMDLAVRMKPNARFRRFKFRALNPVFCTGPFLVCGREADRHLQLWVAHPQGTLAMQGTLDYEDK